MLCFERSEFVRGHVLQVRLVRHKKRRLACAYALASAQHRVCVCMRTACLLDEVPALRERDEDLLRGGFGNCALKVGRDIDRAKGTIHLQHTRLCACFEIDICGVHGPCSYSRAPCPQLGAMGVSICDRAYGEDGARLPFPSGPPPLSRYS